MPSITPIIQECQIMLSGYIEWMPVLLGREWIFVLLSLKAPGTIFDNLRWRTNERLDTKFISSWSKLYAASTDRMIHRCLISMPSLSPNYFQ